MGSARRALVAGSLGLAAVVVGVLVLRSPGAAVEVGWFAYGVPPELPDSLVAWNLTRAGGALLTLVGVLVLAHLLGGLAGRRSRALAARLGRLALVLAGLFLLGGLVAFVALAAVDRGEATVSISKAIGPLPRITPWGSVWTRGQTTAALVAATGLVVGALGTGLRRRNAP